MKSLIITVSIIFSVFISGYKTIPYKTDNSHPGKKIGTIKNDQYIITVDTLKLKEYFIEVIDEPEIKLEKVQIIKGIVVSKKKEDFYMLTAYVKGKNARVTRWLVKEGNDLYFHKMSDEIEENEAFYCTYFFVNCTDNSPTAPMVLDFGDGYGWSTSENPVCGPDSPCTGSKSLRLDEEYPF